MQRVSAVALVPLTLWLVAAFVSVGTADFEEARAWLASPVASGVMLLAIGAIFYHAQLGIQVVLEDYLHAEWLKVGSIVVMKLAAAVLAVVSAVSVLKVSVGG